MKKRSEISLYEKLETVYLLIGIAGFILAAILRWQ